MKPAKSAPRRKLERQADCDTKTLAIRRRIVRFDPARTLHRRGRRRDGQAWIAASIPAAADQAFARRYGGHRARDAGSDRRRLWRIRKRNGKPADGEILRVDARSAR